MKLAILGLAGMLLGSAGITLAQQTAQQDDSLAAAARRARDEKKQQAKTPRVWDNDSIPKNSASLSVVGPSSDSDLQTASAQSGTETKSTTPAADSKKAPSAAEQKGSVEADLAAAKEQLQTLQNDLDILQRKHTLDQQMYYGKPDYNSDKAGAAALQNEQDETDAKQQEMTVAQQKVADLQAKLNASIADTKKN